MTPDFIAVHADWSIKEVFDYVREHGEDSESLNVIYVVDDRGKLVDDLRIREILVQPLESKVSGNRRWQFRHAQRERSAGGLL
jgi:magnesium transporter